MGRLIAGKRPNDLVFTAPEGGPWDANDFRWWYWLVCRVGGAAVRGAPTEVDHRLFRATDGSVGRVALPVLVAESGLGINVHFGRAGETLPVHVMTAVPGCRNLFWRNKTAGSTNSPATKSRTRRRGSGWAKRASIGSVNVSNSSTHR
ncbi:hypothetical protein GCM10010172_44210 [Paractinoplanes ferrugineus]